MPIIKEFRDGSILEKDYGSFDEWCVYITRPGKRRHAPTDISYITRLKELGGMYGNEKLYEDFVQVYNSTNKNLDDAVLGMIDGISETYNNDSLEISILFSILYLAMIAEENKRYSKLGKRIKRLAVHQVLIDDMEPAYVANFSKGRKWREIDKYCNERGF